MTSEDDRYSDPGAAAGLAQDLSRRDFVALSTAAGLGVVAAGAQAADAVVARDVQIRTADGTCDAVFIHPATGVHPGVVVWTDIFGLRPTFRELGRRLAGSGYSVLVPNPFYRSVKAPVLTEAQLASFNFADPAMRAKMMQWAGSINEPGTAARDADAFVNFLDAQREVDTKRKIGTQGYCMGGPLVFKTAAARPDRVGAGATFHGGGLVTDKADSPHLLIPKIKARMYIAIAASDDAKQPDAKDKLRQAFDAAHVQAQVEVYAGTQHGWCVPDMPVQNGMPIYNKPDAERAWRKLLALYQEALV